MSQIQLNRMAFLPSARAVLANYCVNEIYLEIEVFEILINLSKFATIYLKISDNITNQLQLNNDQHQLIYNEVFVGINIFKSILQRFLIKPYASILLCLFIFEDQDPSIFQTLLKNIDNLLKDVSIRGLDIQKFQSIKEYSIDVIQKNDDCTNEEIKIKLNSIKIIDLVSNQFILSKDLRENQEINQLLYVVKTNLTSIVNGKIYQIIKVGKTNYPIEQYIKTLFHDYEQKIVFSKLFAIRFPQKRETEVIDKELHKLLGKSNQSKVFLQNSHNNKIQNKNNKSQFHIEYYYLTSEFLKIFEDYIGNRLVDQNYISNMEIFKNEIRNHHKFKIKLSQNQQKIQNSKQIYQIEQKIGLTTQIIFTTKLQLNEKEEKIMNIQSQSNVDLTYSSSQSQLQISQLSTNQKSKEKKELSDILQNSSDEESSLTLVQDEQNGKIIENSQIYDNTKESNYLPSNQEEKNSNKSLEIKEIYATEAVKLFNKIIEFYSDQNKQFDGLMLRQLLITCYKKVKEEIEMGIQNYKQNI